MTLRYLNADGYATTGQGLNGCNMFAYCGNNPIMRSDPTGQSWESIWGFIKDTVATIGDAVNDTVVNSVSKGVSQITSTITGLFATDEARNDYTNNKLIHTENVVNIGSDPEMVPKPFIGLQQSSTYKEHCIMAYGALCDYVSAMHSINLKEMKWNDLSPEIQNSFANDMIMWDVLTEAQMTTNKESKGFGIIWDILY